MHTPRRPHHSPRAPHPGAPLMRSSDLYTTIIFLIVAFGGLGGAAVYALFSR